MTTARTAPPTATISNGTGERNSAGARSSTVPRAESAPALVLAVTELLYAPELRARLGQGAQTLAAGFRWEAIAGRTLDFYQSIVAA